jgi:hypothetical protein
MFCKTCGTCEQVPLRHAACCARARVPAALPYASLRRSRWFGAYLSICLAYAPPQRLFQSKRTPMKPPKGSSLYRDPRNPWGFCTYPHFVVSGAR